VLNEQECRDDPQHAQQPRSPIGNQGIHGVLDDSMVVDDDGVDAMEGDYHSP
jgi:hypothetical protein